MAPENRRNKLAVALLALIVLFLTGLGLILSRDQSGDQPEVVVKQGNLERPVPGQTLPRGESASVLFETSLGSFEVALDGERAPVAADNFAYLARNGFYDGLGFHRIVPGFVIQGGDPKGDGTGGPGYLVVDPPARDTTYAPGTVAMARSATDPRGAAGSQFFVVTAARAIDLEPDYAVVGTISEGFDVVEEIGRFGGDDERPTRTVVIERARLVQG